MLLTLDIGNTLAKFVATDGNEFVSLATVEHTAVTATLRRLLIESPSRFTALHWCSVARNIAGWDELLQILPIPVKQLLPSHLPPFIQLEYKTPQTLGADRLAAVLGARSLQPHRSLLVIDAGTCITYDVLLADGRYLGGNISPGLDMRLQAMHKFTARLPNVLSNGNVPLLGNTTETALRSGAIHGIRFEIEGYIRCLCEQYADICVFLTGGDSFDFRISAENRIFADKFLIARGLCSF